MSPRPICAAPGPTPTPDTPSRRGLLRQGLAGALGLAGGLAWHGPAAGQAGQTAQAAQAMPLTPAGLPAMRRGFNLAHWFEYERNQPVTGPELQGLAALGLDHMRLPLDPMACGWQPEAPSRLPFLSDLLRAVDLCQAAGLTAVVDLHLRPDHKAAVEDDPRYEPLVAELWTQLARALADRPVSAVAFELYNEPQYYGLAGRRWPPLLRKLLAAVRAQTTRHAVLVSGARGGSIEGLQALTPVADARAVYTFHFYEPFVFTHQGLPWLDDRYTAAGSRRDVLYPARLHAQRPPTALRPHPKAAEEWAEYLKRDWGPAALQREIAPAAAWARRHNVPVVCNEFGAIRANVDPASRYRWLGDVRSALEAQGMGWTVWEYAHIFGLAAQSTQTGQAGRRTLEPLALAALGLGAASGASPAPANAARPG